MNRLEITVKRLNQFLKAKDECPLKIVDVWYNKFLPRYEFQVDCTKEALIQYAKRPMLEKYYEDSTEYGVVIENTWWYVKEER